MTTILTDKFETALDKFKWLSTNTIDSSNSIFNLYIKRKEILCKILKFATIMLGNKESAKLAFESIKQLSPERREKNDIIIACIKYCVYLKGLPTDNLAPEEKDFMKTMAEIDAWYEAEIDKAKLESKIESASSIIRGKFGAETLTPQVVSQLQKLNAKQLDDFMVRMLSWQQQEEMQEWLSRSEKA